MIHRLAAPCLLILALAFPAFAGSNELVVGQPFPHIALPLLDDGRPVSVSDFRGRKLVLHVFASW